MAITGGRYHKMGKHGRATPTPGRRWIWVLLAIALVVVGLGILNC